MTDIYTGRHHDGIQRGLGYSVVTRLCRGIEGKWYNVYFDNFFTLYPLLEDLYSVELLDRDEKNSLQFFLTKMQSKQ